MVTLVGIVVVAVGTRVDGSSAGVALVLGGVGSMFAGGLVLLLSDRTKARAAGVQGSPPSGEVVAPTRGTPCCEMPGDHFRTVQRPRRPSRT